MPRLEPTAAQEHTLTGQMNPRCVRCRRTLIDIIARPGIPCRAGWLPFEPQPRPPSLSDPPAARRPA